jgi:hypothetical protein
MRDNKFKITKAELQQIIKEEYASMAKDNVRAEEIKARISQINEELKTLPETLSEVEATGTKKVKATGWTGDGEGDVKYGEKFEKIGTHLKEDEEVEGEVEIGGDEMEEVDASGYFESKFAELGKELDEKIGGEEAEEMKVDVDADMMGLNSGSEEEVEVEEPNNEDLNEGRNVKTTLLSEGFTPAKKTALDGELERMRRLAKINK